MRTDLEESVNVLGEPLKPCSFDPMTGFFRDGCCNTGPQDRGRHTVCVRVTAEFLDFSRQRGNDLGTPQQSYLYCAAYGNGTFIVRGMGPDPFQVNGRRGEPNDAIHKAPGKDQPVVVRPTAA